MAKNGFRVIDSDMHIVEPVDLWQRYIDAKFKDQAPRGVATAPGSGAANPLGTSMVHPDGRPWGRTGATDRSFQHTLSSKTHAEGNEKIRHYQEMGWTGDGQLEAMDAEGIDVAVLFPTNGLYTLSEPDMDPRLAAAVARAYNDWLHDFCLADPARLMGAGIISPFDVEDAVSETRRCVNELGFKGVWLRPNEVNGRNWYDPYYEPLWSTLEDLGTSLGFHEGTGGALRYLGEQFGANAMLRHVFSHPGEQMLAAASLCGGGVLERHPRLRVAFLEGNCSWLPFLLWRLDEHWERLGEVFAPELKMAPSGYFKRQCFASIDADEEPAKYVVDYMGSDRLIFSTDFPHQDSKFPDAVETFLEMPITEEDKRKILWDNCAYYYGIA